MPRATSEKFSRVHQSPPSQNSKTESAHNPLFNTERFGQHILKTNEIAQEIVDKAAIKPTDRVLEVGPGTGNLTVRILEKAKTVVAIEMDPRMAAELTKRVQNSPEQRKLSIIVGDFMKTDLPTFDVFISNTPYSISSPLVFRLLSHRPLFRVAILMFQQEFARRLVATPGTEMWSRLSANVQLYAQVDHIRDVPKRHFRPPPKVESSVVRLVPRDPPPPVRFEEFDGLTRIIFSRKNKTVHGNFTAKGVFTMLEANWRTWRSCAAEDAVQIIEDVDVKALVESVLTDSGFSDQRGAKMSIDDLLKLLSAFHDAGVHFA